MDIYYTSWKKLKKSFHISPKHLTLGSNSKIIQIKLMFTLQNVNKMKVL